MRLSSLRVLVHGSANPLHLMASKLLISHGRVIGSL
jgi:hypothetical protein